MIVNTKKKKNVGELHSLNTIGFAYCACATNLLLSGSHIVMDVAQAGDFLSIYVIIYPILLFSLPQVKTKVLVKLNIYIQ